MPFALELTLDHLAAARVRELWEKLATAGFTFPAESGANPHVSLVIWDTIDYDAIERSVVSFAMVTPACRCDFPSRRLFHRERRCLPRA
jgi:hypothetical protein